MITITLPERDLKIGVANKGDLNIDLLIRFEELVSKGCHIIFCATRISGTIVEDVEALEKNISFEPFG